MKFLLIVWLIHILPIFICLILFCMCENETPYYRKFKKFLWENPACATIFMGGIIAVILTVPFIMDMILFSCDILYIFSYYFKIVMFVFIFLAYPLLLNILNVAGLFIKKFWARNFKIEMILFVYGALCTLIWKNFKTKIMFPNWYELFNIDLFEGTEFNLTFITMCIAAFMGYLILRLKKSTNTPPLVFILSISGMYIGIFICVMRCIRENEDPMLCVYPVNCFIVAVKVIDDKICEWKEYKKTQCEIKYKKGFFGVCKKILDKSELWVIWGFVFAIPLFDILIRILMYFGQQPDYIIKMWTETADWVLSPR